MASREVEALLSTLSSGQDLPNGAVDDIRAAIESSPYLEEVMIRAARDHQSLRRIEISREPNEGGHYDRVTGAIHINADVFSIKDEKIRLDAVTGVLGHETGHALMAKSAAHTEYRYT